LVIKEFVHAWLLIYGLRGFEGSFTAPFLNAGIIAHINCGETD